MVKNLHSRYSLLHLLLLSVLIICSGIALLWVFYAIIPDPYPNKEFYLLLIIIINMLGVTAFVYKTRKLSLIFKHIGFNKHENMYFLIAIISAFVLWVFDYFYQISLLEIEVNEEAKSWFLKNKKVPLFITFLTTAIFAPIVEEMLFRGIILKTLRNYLSLFWTIVLLSGLFTVIHNSLIQAPSLFIASTLYVFLAYKSGSILPAIYAHILNNTLTFFYYLTLI